MNFLARFDSWGGEGGAGGDNGPQIARSSPISLLLRAQDVGATPKRDGSRISLCQTNSDGLT